MAVSVLAGVGENVGRRTLLDYLYPAIPLLLRRARSLHPPFARKQLFSPRSIRSIASDGRAYEANDDRTTPCDTNTIGIIVSEILLLLIALSVSRRGVPSKSDWKNHRSLFRPRFPRWLISVETAVKLSSGTRASFSKNHSDTARREEIAKNDTRYVRHVGVTFVEFAIVNLVDHFLSLTATHGPKWR